MNNVRITIWDNRREAIKYEYEYEYELSPRALEIIKDRLDSYEEDRDAEEGQRPSSEPLTK